MPKKKKVNFRKKRKITKRAIVRRSVHGGKKVKKVNLITSKWKGIKNKRQGEIFDYVKKELYKENFLTNLERPPNLTNRDFFQYKDYLAQGSYKDWRLNKEQRNYVLKEGNRLYREELTETSSQIRFYQEKAGLKIVSDKKLVKKKQGLKLFFPEKGEGKAFGEKRRESKKVLQEILQQKGSINKQEEVLNKSKLLYAKSPWRIRDRYLVPTDNSRESFGIRQIYEKYVKNNYDDHTRKHYKRAIIYLNAQTERKGELVPDNKLVLDKYGNPILQEGQVLRIDSSKPGRSWTVYKNVPNLETIVRQEVHEVTHKGYIEEYGTQLEIQTWQQKKDKALCWVEAILGESCETNVGTSNWWCLQCIEQGPYHPPVLPKHCPWKYTYKGGLCGTKEHSDANKQWHFSIQGEKTRGAIKGGDWGSCHIGTFGKLKKGKTWKKK